MPLAAEPALAGAFRSIRVLVECAREAHVRARSEVRRAELTSWLAGKHWESGDRAARLPPSTAVYDPQPLDSVYHVYFVDDVYRLPPSTTVYHRLPGRR